MKVAIYNRGRQLAIREQPSADAEVIGTIGSGCAVRVEDAAPGSAPGWLELLGGGYINAAFVTVGTLMDETTYTVSERWKEPEEKPAEQEAVTAEPGRDEPEPDDDDTLKAMKLNELRELAKGSGIALPKNATKAQIIELLMDSDE